LSTAHMSPVTGPVLERSSDTVPSHSSPTGRAPDASTLLFSDTETVTLGAGGTATATSAGYTSQNTGTDYWVATFNGDSNNGTASIGKAHVPTPVTAPTPPPPSPPLPTTPTAPSSTA